jgi:hypothetical protein
MAKKRNEPAWWLEWLEQRRESEELFARMRERFRLEDERDERRRARLHKLTFGLLGRA